MENRNSTTNKTSVGLIGLGRWGKNLARNFHALHSLHAICDSNPLVLKELRHIYPNLKSTPNIHQILNDPEIKQIVIATPMDTHYALAIQCLKAGKDLFIEKPLCLNETESQELVYIAEDSGLILMVGHILQYHPAVSCLQNLISSGELGDILTINTTRTNVLNTFQREDVLWDLAPHDISLILSLLPEAVLENIECDQFTIDINSVVNEVRVNLKFSGASDVMLFFSQLGRAKQQVFVVECTKGIVVFDDSKPWAEKLYIETSSKKYGSVPFLEPLR